MRERKETYDEAYWIYIIMYCKHGSYHPWHYFGYLGMAGNYGLYDWMECVEQWLT
jgi:hypothetical protein